MAGHGTFVWNELRTRDVEKAKAFYGGALGWTFEAFPASEMPYWVAKQGDTYVGGLMELQGAMAELEPGWFGFIEVDDVDARTAKAKTAGAEILREPFDVPTVGRIAILRDPTGVEIGWMTSAKT
jgi:predicted enzyme related to lactoylglutathione lyase